MSENFGRQKSSRWVRASIPTYGDDWGNEYDYSAYESHEENGQQSDSSYVLEEPNVVNDDLDERMEEIINEEKEGTEKQAKANPSSLVLSIDNFKDRDNDSFDSSSDDDEMPELMDDSRPERLSGTEQNSNEFNFNQNEQNTSTSILGDGAPTLQFIVHESKEDFLSPPTPTFSQASHTLPDTPLSDRSFHSDVDSIQKEPENLNIIDPNRFNPTSGDNILESDIVNRSIEEVENEEEVENKEEVDDRVTLTDKSDIINDESTRDYEDAESENFEEGLSYMKPDLSEPKERHIVRTDALDSLINDLQNASINYDTTEGENEMSFENRSISQDVESNINTPIQITKDTEIPKEEDLLHNEDAHEVESQNTYPIEPLTTNDEKELHENYLNELSGHKRSVRKPPPTRQNLVSVDYSNIEDAVSGYMSDEGSLSMKEAHKKQLSTSGSLSTTQDTINSEEDEEVKQNSLNENSSTSTLDPKLTPPQIQHDTFDTSNEINRRASTSSTNTFTLDAWQPNTNNFRDKFINDNDNESNINFNSYGDTNSNYNNFTKLGTVTETSDNESHTSSVSIPDTIDAELPGTYEDVDEGIDEDTQSELGDDVTNASTDPADSIVESLGGDGLIMKQVVEQKRIPSQKVSSLLSPLEKKITPSEEKNSTEEKRNISNSFENSQISKPTNVKESSNDSSSKASFKRPSYPVFNWKSIMATSQPKDRIRLLNEALENEYAYDTGLQNWINETLKQSEDSSTIHIGKIATQAYQNATHIDIRRHGSIRSKVSIVKDKVETSGLQASNLSKRFFSRGKKFMKSSGSE